MKTITACFIGGCESRLLEVIQTATSYAPDVVRGLVRHSVLNAAEQMG
jgi:hypothetical protein